MSGVQTLTQLPQTAGPHGRPKLEPIPSPQPKRRGDFRPYTLHTMERRQYAKDSRARREVVRVRYCPPRCQSRSNITVDSSKAKSNLDVLRLSLKELGWREYPYGRRDAPCDITWVCVSFSELSHDVMSGRINKFPGMVDIMKKANLTRALDMMKRLYPEEYDFYPRTWFMPQQLTEFAADVRQMQNRNPEEKHTFIAKPDDGSLGKGIYLFRDPDEYMLSQRYMVVQEYLSKPFLLEKLKFDLRVYAVLSSIEPLEISICKEGLVRFCTIVYNEPTYKNIHESYMHLTNYSLNKRSSTYVHTDNSNDGSKRTLSSVFTEIGRLGHNIDHVWEDIEKLVVKTIISILPELKVEMKSEMQHRKAMNIKCFQILGFDILLLEDLKPMLLEVNANPSLRIDYDHEVSPGVTEYYNSAVDEEIKQPLIRDTLQLIAPRPYRRKAKRLQRWKKARQQRKLAASVPPPVHSHVDVTHEEPESTSDGETTARTRNIRPYSSGKENRDTENIEKEDNMENTVKDHTEKATKVYTTEDSEKINAMNNEEKHTATENVKYNVIDNKERTTENAQKDSATENFENDAMESFEDVDDNNNPNENTEPDEEEEEKEPSCLEPIYPQKYSEYEDMRLYERVANIFLQSVGVRGPLRMGNSGFRVFTRRCKLTNTGFSTADMDLIFAEMTRKWENYNPDRTAGLCFLGFLEALFLIGRRKFYCRDRIQMLENLLDYCEQNTLEAQDQTVNSVTMSRVGKLPKINKEEDRLDRMKKIYGSPTKVGRGKRSEFYYEFRGDRGINKQMYKKES